MKVVLSPQQTFFSVVWTKSNTFMWKLKTMVSEWVTSVTVRQQLQLQEVAEFIQPSLLSPFVPLPREPSLPSAAAVHCPCQCSGWDTSSGNDLPTHETWEENRGKGVDLRVCASFYANIATECAISLMLSNGDGERKKKIISPTETELADILRDERRNKSSLVLKHFEIGDEVADSNSVASSFGWVGRTNTLLGGSQTRYIYI